MTAWRHPGLVLSLAAVASACQPAGGGAQPATPSVVDVGAATPGQDSTTPRTRECRIETTFGDSAGASKTPKAPKASNTTTEVFLVDTAGVTTELRLTMADSTIVVRRDYDANKRLVSESHRTKDKGSERHVTTLWHRRADGRIESVEIVVVDNRPSEAAMRLKQVVSFPERDAAGHWLRKEGRNDGAPVTRTDTREYDASHRLTTEKTRWLATSERPAKTAETRVTYEGSARTPASEEMTTTNAEGKVTERVSRRFDAAGRLRSELTRAATNAEIVREVKRDELGRIVEERSTGESVRRSAYVGDCVADLEKLFAVTNPDAGEN